MVKFTSKQLKGMNKMLVEHKIEKLCCFYVSDFHLEMILLPYINKKIDENIIIKTEKELRDTVEILISKMNLSKENKDKILNLGWNRKEYKKIEDKSNVIIIGNKEYIDDINFQIKEKNIKNVTVVDCYEFEDVKDKMENIIDNYSQHLNTTGLDIIKI